MTNLNEYLIRLSTLWLLLHLILFNPFLKEELPLEIKSQNIFPTHFSTESFLVPTPIKITKKILQIGC